MTALAHTCILSDVERVTLALVGAGQRGADSYGRYVLDHPEDAAVVAVAEPDLGRRERVRIAHGIAPGLAFADWRDLLARPKLADALLVCTQDRAHFEPTMAALAAGYHVMLEKPMAPEPAQCLALAEAAETQKRILLVCHVLRYTTFFTTIRRLLDEGRIGRLVSIQHNENVAFWHYAHSFVRGNWRRSELSSPMILAKSCHDMDILRWLAGTACVSVASFGSLTHFRPENAPAGAPERCLDGCPAAETCPYEATRFYLSGGQGWPASVISVDQTREALLAALRDGPYGRCVYRCDNDVVDHQVVSLEFADGVTAAFTMSAFTDDVSRTIKLMGTEGEIRGVVDRDRSELEVRSFVTRAPETLRLPVDGGREGHGGGDSGVMRAFVELVRQGRWEDIPTSASASVESHLMAFAAEASRVDHRTVDFQAFTAAVDVAG